MMTLKATGEERSNLFPSPSKFSDRKKLFFILSADRTNLKILNHYIKALPKFELVQQVSSF